jgi:hypothetical protein
MTTLVKIIVTTLISLSLFSCNFNMDINPGVNGNGTVTTQSRSLDQPFSAIKASQGLDVFLTPSETEHVTVEADENLQSIIVTEVVDGVLKIHTKENIGYSKSKKVMVHFKAIANIVASSGSHVQSTKTITAQNLELETSSGSNLTLHVNTNTLTCKASSGSDLNISGKTNQLIAKASSGSDIKAADLTAETANVKASSGADVTVTATKELIAKASSGADIKYYGNPEKVDMNDSASGTIKQK